MSLERQQTGRSSTSSHLTTSTTETDHPARYYYPASLVPTRSIRWRRPETSSRPDLEPGAEFALTKTLTPARDPRYEDPAVWPEDLVDWDGPDDPKNPRNWALRKKGLVTLQLGLTTMGASFASSSFSPAFAALEEAFDISRTVSTLSMSLFVLGCVSSSLFTIVDRINVFPDSPSAH